MFHVKHFRFWCYKVIPLVYDQSLSYYEVLCKVVKYINDLIDQDKIFAQEIEQLKQELEQVQEWIDNFEWDKLEKIIKEYIETFIATMIFVEINNDGYFVYFIPETWEDITFNTTELDIVIPDVDYGHLVLSY